MRTDTFLRITRRQYHDVSETMRTPGKATYIGPGGRLALVQERTRLPAISAGQANAEAEDALPRVACVTGLSLSRPKPT